METEGTNKAIKRDNERETKREMETRKTIEREK